LGVVTSWFRATHRPNDISSCYDGLTTIIPTSASTTLSTPKSIPRTTTATTLVGRSRTRTTTTASC
jgi:hypothetical protein